MRVQTKSCLRYLFIRYTHCITHNEERFLGVEYAAENRGPSTLRLTARGRKQAQAFSPDALMCFAMGPHLLQQPAGIEPIEFDAEPFFVTDGPTADEAADAAGWPPREKRLTIRESRAIPTPDDDSIKLVCVMASSQTILEELQRVYAVIPERSNYGPPLGSITMFDKGETPPFIHCINNTALCPDVCWWHNSV